VSFPRFYVAPDQATLAPGIELTLPPGVARHALQVLRLRTGDAIALFDGRGGEYPATVASVGKSVRARLGKHASIEREPSIALTLVQSLTAADVMDWIVRKAVELGVAAIEPVVATRSQRAPAERLDRRTGRWQQIAIAACEQCGRNRIPRIAPIEPLSEWLPRRGDLSDAVLLGPAAPTSLSALARIAVPTTVLIGPEGGFDDGELRAAAARGARMGHLGARVLRAETAALAALATLNAIAGDAR
jgi:16S rRNA (uracil1498-N3)-methyltransferase